MAHAPLAHHVTHKQHAPPDQPAEKRAEALQGREFNVLAVNPIPVPMRQGVGDEEIQAGNDNEAHARDSTQVDLGFQNGQIDQAVTFLVEPQPIHEHVHAVGEEGQENQHKQNNCHYDSNPTILFHGDSPALSSHSGGPDVKKHRAIGSFGHLAICDW